MSYIRSEQFLFGHLALKGGTALILTIFDLPRLSVDIDLDYTNNSSRDDMLKDRKIVKSLLIKNLKKNGYQLSKDIREHHALNSIKATYINAGGNLDNIKIEINYMLRVHIYEPVIVKTKKYGLIGEVATRTVDPVEIFGSKLVALMTRSTPRDLYDFFYMINANIFNEEEIKKIKKCAVFYRAISNEDGIFDFNLDNLDSITQNNIKRFLMPVINAKEFFSLSEAKLAINDFFNNHFILDENESMFIEQFKRKKYIPELLYDGGELKRIQNHPMAIWKTRETKKS